MSRRRLRCPYCRSLNTVEAMSNNREGTNCQFFWVCDDCDMSWSPDPKSELYHPPAKAKAQPKPKLLGARP